jgi:transcriptional regulator GlxA family with amidase domain
MLQEIKGEGMQVNCLVFNNFETLDLFGPVEVLANIGDYSVNYYSMDGGEITNRHNVRIQTGTIDAMEPDGIVVIPGGQGTRALVNDAVFIAKLKEAVEKSTWCLTICTGSALVAKTGLLDNCNATSNKMAFAWAQSNGPNVRWQYRARWVVDTKYYTSSGVSAGIDMSLGFVADRYGEERAREIARRIEYEWENDKEHDPFAIP